MLYTQKQPCTLPTCTQYANASKLQDFSCQQIMSCLFHVNHWVPRSGNHHGAYGLWKQSTSSPGLWSKEFLYCCGKLLSVLCILSCSPARPLPLREWHGGSSIWMGHWGLYILPLSLEKQSLDIEFIKDVAHVLLFPSTQRVTVDPKLRYEMSNFQGVFFCSWMPLQVLHGVS